MVVTFFAPVSGAETCAFVDLVSTSSIQGELGPEDCKVQDLFGGTDESFLDVYSLSVPIVTEFQLSMTSTEVDAFLRVLTSDLETLAIDDDSGDQFNARITITLEAGSYLVLANSATSTGETGVYELTVVAHTGVEGNEPPNISLLGPSTLTIQLGSVFVEPGFLASDVEDGDITNQVLVSGHVNANLIGIYQRDYVVVDSLGLTGSAQRVIEVVDVQGDDYDSDGIPDELDLDDDNDGFFDVIDVAPLDESIGAPRSKVIQIVTALSGRDSDKDGLTDLEELRLETDPLLEDTDGDGVDDGDEVLANTDPLVPSNLQEGQVPAGGPRRLPIWWYSNKD